MSDIYIFQGPEKEAPNIDDLGVLGDSQDLNTEKKPKRKFFSYGKLFSSLFGMTQGTDRINIDRGFYIPGAVNRAMLYGTTVPTASPGNTIFEFIGDVEVMTNLDQSVRFFLNDQEIRVDTFNNTAAGEARVVACKLRGTIQVPLPLIDGDTAGTLEIAGAVEKDDLVYPRAFLMIRNYVDGSAAANGYVPTKTIFYNRKVDGVDSPQPDEAGQIDKYNNLVWGTATIATDVFNRAKLHAKGDAGGFAKFGMKDQVGINPHDEHLIYFTDTNAGRGDGFVYGNQYDGWLIKSGNALFRSQGGSSGACGRNASQGSAGVLQPNRMTTTQRDALTGLQGGDMIFNTTTNKHQGYNGTTWNDLY